MKGEIAVFEPVNYKSYKNAVKKVQSKSVEAVLQPSKNIGLIMLQAMTSVHFDSEEPDNCSLMNALDPEELEVNEWQELHNS